MVEAEEQREKERKATAAGKEHKAKQHADAADKKEDKAMKEENQKKNNKA
jgi:hypothetical protein